MIKFRTILLYRLLPILLLASSTLRAQKKNEGDEEKKMNNQVQSIDKQAISDATNGWWKANW